MDTEIDKNRFQIKNAKQPINIENGFEISHAFIPNSLLIDSNSSICKTATAVSESINLKSQTSSFDRTIIDSTEQHNNSPSQGFYNAIHTHQNYNQNDAFLYFSNGNIKIFVHMRTAKKKIVSYSIDHQTCLGNQICPTTISFSFDQAVPTNPTILLISINLVFLIHSKNLTFRINQTYPRFHLCLILLTLSIPVILMIVNTTATIWNSHQCFILYQPICLVLLKQDLFWCWV